MYIFITWKATTTTCFGTC